MFINVSDPVENRLNSLFVFKSLPLKRVQVFIGLLTPPVYHG